MVSDRYDELYGSTNIKFESLESQRIYDVTDFLSVYTYTVYHPHTSPP